ncbi:MAG: lycopene cyclase family protein [Gemmatimonadetes bacterium]|nr:lycopene cyclase family protein [Gemmatimonadota bacterium]
MLDVLVIGRGPAGLAAAAALGERGVATGVLGPHGPVRWPARYGAWADELGPAGLEDFVEHRWPETVVGLGGGERRVLPRAYVRVDRDRLAESLVERCERTGVRRLDGAVVGAEHHPAGSTVRLADGEVRARLVVDASGHRPALVRRAARPPQGFQTAFGAVVEGPVPGVEPGRATLMEWDDAGLPPSPAPTFLYALPLPDGRVFVEETVLVGRPAVPLEVLEARLRARLATRGVVLPAHTERERCWIPMGGALPDPRQRVVGFGGAAGMVHPATGYLLARTLAAAPTLADALAGELGRPGGTPEGAARAGWAALWPADRRRRHALFRFGMEVLLRLDAADTRAFFAAFFALPEADWRGYLSDRLPALQLAGVMSRLFAAAPARLRRRLATPALGPNGVDLVRSLLS